MTRHDNGAEVTRHDNGAEVKVALEVWASAIAPLQATAVRAEDLGFDALYYGESPHDLNLECWTTLAAVAVATERLRLGPVITNVLPDYRSAALLVKQAATVDHLSEGRVDIRTGVGAAVAFARPWWEPFGVTYPAYDERLTDLVELLDRLPDLWPTDDQRPPITIAATGARAMSLAATRADVWETSFCTPSEFAARNDECSALAADRSVVRSLEIDGFLGPDDATTRKVLDHVERDRGSNEDLEPILERALVGPPARAAERIDALAAAGVDQIVVALHDPHDPAALDALATARAMA